MSETNDKNLVTSEVQSYLEKQLQELDIKNYTLVISPGTIRGDNYLGIIAKVQVKGEDKNGNSTTFNLIVKSAPRNAVRSIAPIRQAYLREIYMYSKVFPEFTKLQEEKGVLKPFKSFAKYYSSTMDDLNEALIMQDMNVLGFQLQDRHHPLDYNHALLVMKEYGKFHALSYALRDQKPELFKELSDNTEDSFFSQMNTDLAARNRQVQLNKALEALDPVKHKVAYEKFKNFQKKMTGGLQEVVKSEPAGKYAVIGHGDSWMNNFLFKYENSAQPQLPTELCLIDWQLSRFASPALDLAYFILSCSDKNLRDEHYDHLIHEYYDSFSTFLRELGSDPDKLFPFEVLQEHLKKFSVYGLHMAIMVLFVMMSEVEEIPDVPNSTNVEDMIENLKYESKNVETYNSRIRGIILDFVKYGYDF